LILILDIDMTIADGSARFAAAGAEPDKADKASYDAWLAKAQGPGMLVQDEPVAQMQELLDMLSSASELHYVTSRSNKHRVETLAWLRLHEFPLAELHMRKDDDYRQAYIYKEEVLRLILTLDERDGNVIVLDDDPAIAGICHRNGWLHLQPNLRRSAA
jgi:hypothetical protein